jgi:hypothetical protein
MLGFYNSTTHNEYRPKNLTPWLDSNPGSSVLQSGAMTTMPHRLDVVEALI